MTPAIASLIALVVAIVLSITSRINVGLFAIAFAWLIGVYVADLAPDVVIRGFPVSLFVTLAGVTLLFALAETNGTLERLANGAVRLARGNVRVIPIVFFAVACVLSSVGPGSISSVALIAPLAMTIAVRTGVPVFLTALMVANGANAGNLSPFSAVGIIANDAMAKAGVGGHPGKVFLANFVAHLVVAAAAYLLLGVRRRAQVAIEPVILADATTLTRAQVVTLGVIAAWIVGVVAFNLNLGLSAFAGATVLLALRAADEAASLRKVPWGAILLVCGVSMLVALLERTGGMELFTALLAKLATPDSVNGVLAFITGLISTYSSTMGVVLPTFLPTVGSMVQQLGGGDPLALALSINVGASLVDVSPLSTLGALCIAAVADQATARVLFRRLMVWGLSMAVVGAVLCQLFAGYLARW